MAIHPPIPLLEETYGFKINRISPMGKHLILRTEKYNQSFLLKSLTELNAKYAGEALRHLERSGLYPSPMWQKPLTGKDALLWRSFYWVLAPWHEGSTAPAFSRNEFPKLIRLLNQVHQHGRSTVVGWPYDHAQYVAKRLADLERGYPGQKQTRFSQLYHQHLSHFALQAKISSRLLSQLAPFAGKPTLCHGDPSPKNTLILPDRRWILIDWDLIVRAHRWWELSQAIRRFNLNYAWKHWALWDLLAKAQPKAELTSIEKQALWASLVFPQEFWRIGYQYFTEKLSRPESWYLHRLQRILHCETQRQISLHLWFRQLR